MSHNEANQKASTVGFTRKEHLIKDCKEVVILALVISMALALTSAIYTSSDIQEFWHALQSHIYVFGKFGAFFILFNILANLLYFYFMDISVLYRVAGNWVLEKVSLKK